MRYRVVVLLCLLTFILYLDRICISQAASSIENDLKISHTAMGFVLAAFTVAYGLFQVPVGHWGDRHGSRGVLTRIVLWWSVFTALTGAATGLVMLLLVRFLFGAGEAGALPNAARVVSRWFPPDARGPAQGAVVTAALVGGALSPMVTEYLLGGLGWRWSFVALGVPGLLWAAVFWWWYRDDPAAHPQTNERERRYIRSTAAPTDPSDRHPPVPWRQVLSSPNIWLLGGVITCGSFTTYMFFSWYPTYLKEGREVSPALSGWLAGLVLGGGRRRQHGGRIPQRLAGPFHGEPPLDPARPWLLCPGQRGAGDGGEHPLRLRLAVRRLVPPGPAWPSTCSWPPGGAR